MTPPSSKIGRNKSSSNDHHDDDDTVTEEEETATATFYDTIGIAATKDDNDGYNYNDDAPVNHIAAPITDTPHATPNRNTLTPSTSVGRGSSSNSSSYSKSQSQSQSHTKNINNNNYSAPHTPIASAKRPRNPYSSRRSTGATKNKVTHGNYTGTSFATENDSRPSPSPSSSLSISSKAWNLLGGGGKHRSSIGGSDSGSANVHGGGQDTLPDQEEAVLSSVMSPVRKMKLVESSSSSRRRSSPLANATVIDATATATTSLSMSPMHPVRPVTKYDKDVTMPNHTGVKISSFYQDELTKDGGVITHDDNNVVDGIVGGGAGAGAGAGASTTASTAATATTTTMTTTTTATTRNMNQSSSPSVLKSIFSPVLNFLNHSSTKDKDVAASIAVVDDYKHKDKHAARQKPTRHEVDLDGDVCMCMQGEGDTMEDVLEDAGAGADADGSTLPLPAVDNHNHNNDNNNNNRIHVEDDDYGHFTATSPTVDSQQDEISVQDQEELDIEEEFNPYLFIKYLPPYETVVPNPQHKICLPPKNPSDPPISLVLDLDETLVHCTVEPISDADMTFPVVFNGMQYKVHVRLRPFLREFLEAVHDKFEVIVFTASQEVYANELLNRIDPDKKYIKHRMFRESCLLVEGNFLKDLNVLGRDLSQTVLVDNSPHAFGYQINNGIPIESWFDDPNDTELLKLEQFCSTLHGVKDVRTMVRSKFQTYKMIRDA